MKGIQKNFSKELNPKLSVKRGRKLARQQEAGKDIPVSRIAHENRNSTGKQGRAGFQITYKHLSSSVLPELKELWGLGEGS